MRIVLLIVLWLLATPVLAEDVRRYENARFGYVIEVPASFTAGPVSDNGDGRGYRRGATRLQVWGGSIVEDSFESAAYAAMGFANGEGWRLGYEAVTPGWASFSGTRGQRVLYQRMIALCDGQYAAFTLEYTAAEMSALDPVVNQLVRSLRATEEGC